MPKISDLRDKIDKIDDQLLKLINRRAALAIQIGKEKHKKNSSNHFHVPHREREIIERLKTSNPGPFPNDSVESVFREVFSATLALEKPLNIGFLGPTTTFSHQAALKQFGHSTILTPLGSIEAIFKEVERGNCHYGIVPVENSTEGVINLTLDCFVDSKLLVCDELKLPIALYLLSTVENLKEIKTIYSHPQPLAQCRGWINQNLSWADTVPASSTANAAERAKQDTQSAAVAGPLAAEVYGLHVLSENIQDRRDNFTRFWVIGKEEAKKARKNKTSIMFSIKDEAGSLLKALRLFARHEINLTKIQSRPLRNRAWEYLFFVDFDGHVEEEKVQKVLTNLGRQCLFLRVMGSYPKAGTRT